MRLHQPRSPSAPSGSASAWLRMFSVKNPSLRCPGKQNEQLTRRRAPISPPRTTSMKASVRGLCIQCTASMICTPAAAAARTIPATAAASSPTGFSIRTCFPAAQALCTHSTCSVVGSGM